MRVKLAVQRHSLTIRSLPARWCAEAHSRAWGFTLIEMTVAIFVIALLLGSLLIPLTTQVEQRQVSDMEKTLSEIKDVMLGFAVANGYLPCPDTDADGLENVAGTGQCSTVAGGIAAGRLPHGTLGLTNSDVWGNRLTYVINEQFARRSPATTFSLTTGGSDVRICTSQACTTTLSTTAVAAVISHGRNGYGATGLVSGLVNSCPTPPAHPNGCSADEQDNFGTDADIVSRVRTAAGAAAGEFDDIVAWLPRYALINRMIAAGRLP
jgi:type II secretory pathway pseudopilin PulG